MTTPKSGGGPGICAECSAEAAKTKLSEPTLQDQLVDIIYDWKWYWMNQTQNDQADYENYRRRAFGIDANMIHSLARRIAEKFK